MSEDMKEDEISLLDYLIVLLRRKRLIASATLASAILAAVVSLFLPKAYRAETKILPPQRSGGSSGAAQLLGTLSAGGVMPSSLDFKSTSDLYAGMLKSRTVLDRITDRFGLMKLYNARYREDMRTRLGKDILFISIDKKSGILSIQVEDRDPGRAAEMANAFVEELRAMNSGLAISEAAQRRLFYEEQMKEVRAALTQTEEELRRFQEKTGALRVEEQTKSIIEGIAEMRAQIAAKEVELKVMRTYATPNNPDLQKQEETLAGLKFELGKLEFRGSNNGPDPLMPTGRMPSVGTEYMRKLREVKFNETLYGLISAQYEAAKLDEAKDARIIQVIDKAVPPEKKSRPNRTFMTLTAGLAGFFFSVFAAFLIEFIERAPENGDKERIEAIKRHLNFGIIKSIGRFRRKRGSTISPL